MFCFRSLCWFFLCKIRSYFGVIWCSNKRINKMQAPSKDKLQKLQAIIGKMSYEVICACVLPSLGLRVKDLNEAIRKAQLNMTAGSVARVLRAHLANATTDEELGLIIKQVTLQQVAFSCNRVWHAVTLLEPTAEPEPAHVWSRELRGRILRAARRSQRDHARVEVHSEKIGDFVFVSLQKVTGARSGIPLYVAAAASQPVAFVTKMGGGLLQAAVEGLGFKKHQDANLYGRDLNSLLRILERTWNVNVNQLTDEPEYDPRPVITKNGIDYTHKTYNEAYVDMLVGPDPPLLNNLDIMSEKPFFDPSRLNKSISVRMSLKSDNVAGTLKSWAAVKAIPPTSELIKIFNQLRTNKFTYNVEDDD